MQTASPFIRGDNVQQGFIRWGDKTKKWAASEFADLERYHLLAGDVILAMDRPIVGEGLKMAWIKHEDLPALLVQRVCRLRGKIGIALTDFLRYVLAAPGFSVYIHRITTGANIPHISGKDILAYEFRLPDLQELSKKTFRALPILRPSPDLLRSFEMRVYPHIQQIRILKKQINALGKARDLLIPKLMSGQLDVSGIPLPAEVGT